MTEENPIEVLIVDDSAVMRSVISRIISAETDMKVVGTAENGELGVKSISSLKPDVVILDLEMPVMDGIAATREIRETLGFDNYELPVIALTANAMPEDIAAFFEVGIDDYILKPVKAQDLIAKIDHVIHDDHMMQGVADSPEEDRLFDIPLFDQAQYNSLVGILGADKSFEIYREFQSDANERMKELRSGALDHKRIHAHLHSMSSMAGNMGFKRMESECRRLLDVLPTIPEAVLNEDLKALEQLYQQGCVAFDHYRGAAA